MLHITLRQMEYVVAVGRAGSLALASSWLNVSQPALSVAIAQVEARLGAPLFHRRKGVRIMPTSYGHRFLQKAEALVAQAERLERPGALASETMQKLRLGILAELAPRWLAPILVHLRAAFPDLETEVQPVGFPALVEALRTGRIDVGLTYDLGLDASFLRERMTNVAPVVWVAPSDRIADRVSVPLSELADRPLILSDHDFSIQHMIGLFRRLGTIPLVRHRAASIELMRSLAANGEGTGVSYTNPAGSLTDDGKPVARVPVADDFAVEPILMISIGATNPPLPEVMTAVRALVASAPA